MRAKTQALAIDSTRERIFCALILTLAVYGLLIIPALADGDPGIDTPMGSVVCTIVEFALGNLGRGLATCGIIIVGVGATLGRVTWGMAITVAIGIAVIFYAPQLVVEMTGTAADCAY